MMRYLIKGKDNIYYSPDQWLIRLSKVEPETILARNVTLAKAGLTSCYYRDVRLGGPVGQPAGYCGLPPELAKLWNKLEGMSEV
ncbi:hypothetical protein PG994_013869 [Apiospora phragmitis]|uniref:Uncharacterized protein n=1 Tax=Apiospora phragmitis TaxID=2905665 RepID=A0ABR1T2P9_9PEZI